MELYSLGLISKKDTGGLELEWGNCHAVSELIEQIASCTGFGAVLAAGPRQAANYIGRGSDQYLWWSKGLVQSDPVDLRKLRGFALAAAVSTRGACHLRGRPTLEILGLSAERLFEIYGTEVSRLCSSSVGKATMVARTEELYAVADAIGICKFAIQFNHPQLLGFPELSSLVTEHTHLALSADELRGVGRKIVDQERAFNFSVGADKNDDWLPKRCFQPLAEDEPEQVMTEQELLRLIVEYYQVAGYDRTGVVPPQRKHPLSWGVADEYSTAVLSYRQLVRSG